MADSEYARMAQRRKEEAEWKARREEEKRLAAERDRAERWAGTLAEVRAYLDRRDGPAPLDAVAALGGSGDAQAGALLREALGVETLRLHAFRALARTDAAAKALRRALAGDGEVSRELDLALGAVHAQWACAPASEAVPMLVEALKRESPYRLEILRALGANADARAVVPLLLGTIDNNAEVRLLANEMLKKRNSWGDVIETVGPLLEALCSANGQVRQNATNALAKIRGWSREPAARAAIPALVMALGRLPDSYSVWRTELVSKLEVIDREWPSSAEAAQTIPSLVSMHIARQPGAAPLLSKIPRWQTAAQAPTAIPALVAALANDDAALRHWAAAALDEIDLAWPSGSAAVEGVPIFIGLLEHSEAQRRLEALGFLARISDPRVVEPIVRRIYDKDEAVRTKAVALLADSGDPQIVPLLIAEIEKKSAAAATLLGDIGDERAVEPLLAALRERSMRTAVARALRKFPNASARLRSQLLPIARQAVDLTRAATPAGWRDFLSSVDPYLAFGAIPIGYSSSSEDGYLDVQDPTYEEAGYLLRAAGEDKIDRTVFEGIVSTSLIAAGKPAVYWLRSGRLLEVETTKSSSHAAMSSSSRHWSTRQRLFEIEAFESREDRIEALRRCCGEFLPILRELCDSCDEAFASAHREMVDSGIA